MQAQESTAEPEATKGAAFSARRATSAAIDWRYDEAGDSTLDGAQPTYLARGYRCQLDMLLRLDCVGPGEDERWAHSPNFRGSVGALTGVGQIVIVAIFSPSAAGAHVTAFDLTSGEALWAYRIPGMSSAHSAYSNRVRIEIRQNKLHIYGAESDGRYVLVLDPASGKELELHLCYREPSNKPCSIRTPAAK
jgi:hypothetical protein